MRIGIDIDGVLANFCTAYEAAVVKETGRDVFPPWKINEGPITWDWPQAYGYTNEEVGRVWKMIKSSPDFWLSLDELPDMKTMRNMWSAIDFTLRNDIYFITARPGLAAKQQAEQWLRVHGIGPKASYPTVLMASNKGLAARVLRLDYYVDDNYDNAVSVITENGHETQSYLIDRVYNRPASRTREQQERDMAGPVPRRISGLFEFFDSIQRHDATVVRTA